jgi:hypothetical protein
MSKEQLKQAQNQLELMTTIFAELPDQVRIDNDGKLITSESNSQLSAAEGQAARAIRMLLFQLDHARAFGDLRRVQTSGGFIWVCVKHYAEYDPGLPSIPHSSAAPIKVSG